ncbi:MAG: Uma2 family endonuclease [Limnothrix sp. RL_2_0]|nr:Uma2 family endonuclease [Limnothrix sp. RL_2_0]
MIALSSQQPLTPEEYLELEKTSEIKHEYIDGEIYAMAGGTGNHNLISTNLLILIRNRLNDSGCRTYLSDMKVNLQNCRRFFYPDLVVTCDKKDDPKLSYVHFPKVVIEVLSPSTESFDRGQKFEFYRSIPSLQEYILINSDHYLVECFRRQKQDIWLLQTYKGLGAIAYIEALDIYAPLSDIYAMVEFEPATEI